jgi:hypothetical protein
LPCTLEKLNCLLEHSRKEPGLLDARGIGVHEKLSCPYSEKAYLPSTLEKLNCLLEHSREEPGLLDAQGVAVQYSGERVNVDVGESVRAERLRGVLVNGLQAERRQLRLVKQTRLQKTQ